jgi:hypothetical protein
MQKRLILSVLCAGVAALMMGAAEVAKPETWTRDGAWQSVRDAEKKGRPKTAIEHLEPIIQDAMARKDYPEAIKAIGMKIAFEGRIQGNKPEEQVTRMQKAIEESPAEMKPVMNAILARWYWHYFQQNRWRIMQRTERPGAEGGDLETWSLARVLEEIDKQFPKALSAGDQLKQIPIGRYDALLDKGTVPDSHRPTLFDFLAYDALEFYSAGEQAGARAQDTFDLMADSPIFGPAKTFMDWKPDATDEDSPTLKAIKLYQELLRFHVGDEDKSAFLEADLSRLQFGYNKAFGEEKADRYKMALKGFTDEWADHPISARGLHAWATVLQGENELVKAHELATRGKNAFPDSFGGKMCHNLIEEIEAKSVSIGAERVWNKPLPTIAVSYRNIDRVHFRAYRYDFPAQMNSEDRLNAESLNRKEIDAWLSKPPDLEWSADLPPTKDYRQRTEEAPAPAGLKPGAYFVFASVQGNFKARKENQASYTSVWVSDLALVLRTDHSGGALEGFVMNAITGEPIEGADVRGWTWQWGRGGNKKGAIPRQKTDANGFFRVTGLNQKQCVVYAEHDGHALASPSAMRFHHGGSSAAHEQTIFFTDRSLYRPGQTVQYKGLCIRIDQQKDNYKAVGGRKVTVLFADPNGKEVEKREHKTNAYGSFSGSFTAPRDRLTGQMSIRVEGEPTGSTWIGVEEYKRPKFRVEVASPEKPARLNDTVTVTGKATAYTGAAVGGAKVRYRVVRAVQYPDWWYWRYWWRPSSGGSQEIAHGSAATGSDGKFEIAFTAKPDPAVSEEDEAVFSYTVYADVTDTTGETRSSDRIVRVGYTALQAAMSAEDWLTAQKPVEIKIHTSTPNGQGEAADGTIEVYSLKQPATVQRAALRGDRSYRTYRTHNAGEAPEPDPSNPNSWALGKLVKRETFKTGGAGIATNTVALEAGIYRVLLETQDKFGKKVTARLPLQVVDLKASQFAIKLPNHLAAPEWSVEPGGAFLALWGTGYEVGRAFIEIERRGELVKRFWTAKDATQEVLEYPVTEAMRGGFMLHVTYVRENRAYLTSRRVDVPWKNKDLSVRWEHFVSKLDPGKKETWTAVVSGPEAEKVTAEMVAGLYDASLDAYKPHAWLSSLKGHFYSDRSWRPGVFANHMEGFSNAYGAWRRDYKQIRMTYRSWPDAITRNMHWHPYAHRLEGGRGRGGEPFGAVEALKGSYNRRAADGAPEPPMEMTATASDALSAASGNALAANRELADRSRLRKKAEDADKAMDEDGQGAAAGPDLSKVSARKNLQETAFFFPHLVSAADGTVKIEFTMPEALTEWKFMGFAHDADLRSGFLTDTVVTAKDLMVEPNAPRFVREGDELEFTVKVSNQSATRQKGAVRLTFADARTLKDVNAELGLQTADLSFNIPSKESQTFAWRIAIPDGMGFLTYKAVGSTGKLSDGEEGYLPVLSRRILVTESLTLPVRGKQTKPFTFRKLVHSGKSDTLKSQTLTLQMVSQPAWYAVMALPYLMESPHEGTEQTFNRLYANCLARHIANADPKIRRVFDQWKGTKTLDSPMEKNQDLKSVMLEETPWLQQAQDESQARRNVGILFDANRLDDETRRLQEKLADQQHGDGAWPWFPGGYGNDYITLYITTGYGRLRHLGVKDVDVAPAIKSINRLDGWIKKIYDDIVRKDANHLSPTIALYLYGRSYFLEDKPVAPQHKVAVDYFLGQAAKYWLELHNRQSQAHLAIALKRFGDPASAKDIMTSIKEHAVYDEELGMFWRDTEFSWWWYRAPIETQAMMIEAFDEVMGDEKSVEECRVWLLKQKQTQDWKTTKATADAVYGLLLRGTDLLASDALVEVKLGSEWIKPEKVEAGTGYYEERFVKTEIKPEMGNVTVKKVDDGVSWGSLHWQYLEDMSKVTPHEGTPLKLKKQIYVREFTKKGPVLRPVKGALAVGDELVTRVEVRVDRDMEYVHLKDQRGSGTEPVNVLSQYKYQDGLAYYESTKDTASHFFIDYLPKGAYVFEYSTRVQLKGEYQSGMANIQCMYAPEFNSHSESHELVVK